MIPIDRLDEPSATWPESMTVISNSGCRARCRALESPRAPAPTIATRVLSTRPPLVRIAHIQAESAHQSCTTPAEMSMDEGVLRFVAPCGTELWSLAARIARSEAAV